MTTQEQELAQEPESKRGRSVAGAAVVFVLILLSISGVKSWNDLSAAREREAGLVQEIAESEARIESYEEKIERMKDDPLMLERLAREDLGLVRPDDVVILVPDLMSTGGLPTVPPKEPASDDS